MTFTLFYDSNKFLFILPLLILGWSFFLLLLPRMGTIVIGIFFNFNKHFKLSFFYWFQKINKLLSFVFFFIFKLYVFFLVLGFCLSLISWILLYPKIQITFIGFSDNCHLMFPLSSFFLIFLSIIFSFKYYNNKIHNNFRSPLLRFVIVFILVPLTYILKNLLFMPIKYYWTRGQYVDVFGSLFGVFELRHLYSPQEVLSMIKSFSHENGIIFTPEQMTNFISTGLSSVADLYSAMLTVKLQDSMNPKSWYQDYITHVYTFCSNGLLWVSETVPLDALAFFLMASFVGFFWIRGRSARTADLPPSQESDSDSDSSSSGSDSDSEGVIRSVLGEPDLTLELDSNLLSAAKEFPKPVSPQATNSILYYSTLLNNNMAQYIG